MFSDSTKGHHKIKTKNHAKHPLQTNKKAYESICGLYDIFQLLTSIVRCVDATALSVPITPFVRPFHLRREQFCFSYNGAFERCAF